MPKSFFYGILEDDFGCVSSTIKMASPFEDKYSNIDHWVNERDG